VAAEIAAEVSDRRVLTYGIDQPADVSASDIRVSADGLRFNVRFNGHSRRQLQLNDLQLPMHGRHNVLNALAALTVANELGIEPADMARAIQQFQGVKRRFTRVGQVAGAVIIDDYAHHPVEIAAVLRAARSICTGRLIAVVQPHRYSRVASLMEQFASCFGDADVVLVSDIYSAGESPMDGVTQESLISQIQAQHPGQVQGFETPEQLGAMLAKLVHDGDYVVCMGAGTISNWAYQLPDLMAVAQAA
jgi:UDP-N-acetylmuramate--alanine ligase